MTPEGVCTLNGTLAMASVPMQEWCEPYDFRQALFEGTMFPCLNLEFFMAEGKNCEKPSCIAKDKTESGHAALDKAVKPSCLFDELNAVSFVINDLTLYLDTHPDCPNGLSLFKKLLKKRLDLLSEYASKENPLTQLSMITGTPDSDCYGWGEGPAPWEGGLINVEL